MKKTVYHLAIFVLIILFIPYVITMTMTGTNPVNEDVIPYDGRIVIKENENFSQALDYSQYLTGIVARNLISFDENVFETPEFLKLNCVIANTFLNNEFSTNSTISDEFLSAYYISNDDLLTYWGENYTTRMDAIQKALSETQNLIITHNNAPIKPYQHFISNGMTRVLSDTNTYPYLNSVNTNKDLEEKGFLCVISYSETDFINKINSLYPDSGLTITSTSENTAPITNLRESLQIINRDSAGYVNQIQVGNLLMSGDDFMNLMDLNSPSFTITFQENTLKIITKGIGHGYGISLSYALRMAQSGSTYQDIISFFYKNVEIKNYK